MSKEDDQLLPQCRLAEISPEKRSDGGAEKTCRQADANRHERSELRRSPQGHDDHARAEDTSGRQERKFAEKLEPQSDNESGEGNNKRCEKNAEGEVEEVAEARAYVQTADHDGNRRGRQGAPDGTPARFGTGKDVGPLTGAPVPESAPARGWRRERLGREKAAVVDRHTKLQTTARICGTALFHSHSAGDSRIGRHAHNRRVTSFYLITSI